MTLTDEEQERMTKIETTVKELSDLVEALAEELRTAKLTVDQDAQIQGNLAVGGTIAGNLAADSVGNSQIVAQAITADKIKDGQVGTN